STQGSIDLSMLSTLNPGPGLLERVDCAEAATVRSKDRTSTRRNARISNSPWSAMRAGEPAILSHLESDHQALTEPNRICPVACHSRVYNRDSKNSFKPGFS